MQEKLLQNHPFFVSSLQKGVDAVLLFISLIVLKRVKESMCQNESANAR